MAKTCYSNEHDLAMKNLGCCPDCGNVEQEDEHPLSGEVLTDGKVW